VADGICVNDGCELPRYVKERCKKHYRAWHRKYGTPRVHVERPTVCTVEGCDQPVTARDLCPMHYQRWRTKGDPGPADPHRIRGPRVKLCSVEGCGEMVKARGWCSMHYARVIRHGEPGGPDIQRLPLDAERAPCKIDGCEKPASRQGKGWCWTHYGRYRTAGDPGPAEIGSYRSRTGECEIGGCGRPIQSDRLCQMHYPQVAGQGRDSTSSSGSRRRSHHSRWLPDHHCRRQADARTPGRDGTVDRSPVGSRREGPSHQREQDRQFAGESSALVQGSTSRSAGL